MIQKFMGTTYILINLFTDPLLKTGGILKKYIFIRLFF